MILQKVLGATDYKIITIYVIILEIQIIIADFFGCMIGLKFTSHLTDVVSILYEMEDITNNADHLWLYISSILISNIAMLPFIVFMKQVINKKDIVSVINNKD